MIKTEFGIIYDFNPEKEYSDYEPEKYNCVSIDDEYINDWWEQLLRIPTYNMSIKQPQNALSRWGVTLIPPESLPLLLQVVESDPRIQKDGMLAALAEQIRKAMIEHKYMIHFGI